MMPVPEGERIAKVEEKIQGLREDVQALTTEQERTRQRLHSLEGTTAGLVKTASVRAEVAAESSRRVERNVKILSALVALAGIVGPLVYTGATH